MAGFPDLPAELIMRTLWFLDLPDVLSCQISNRLLFTIIEGSMLLKYLTALKAAGMEDNRLCTIGSMSKRLQMLNLREDAWEAHLVKFSQKIRIPASLKSSRPLRPTGGIYFFDDSTSLSYVSLPSNAHDEAHWSHIEVETGIIDVGFAIYEHDLIAIVTPPFVGSMKMGFVFPFVIMSISFFQASTGKSYPFVTALNLSITRFSEMCIKITGDHLTLLTGYDSVDVYEWKTGILKMKIMVPGANYSELLFLSSNVLLLSNTKNHTFEFWDIPDSPQVEPLTCPSVVLEFPPIDQNCTTTEVHCRNESLVGRYGTRYSPFPFHSSPADDIASFDFFIGHFVGPQDVHDMRFIMVVHIRSLLDLYSTSRLSSPPQPEGSSAGVNAIPWNQWGPQITRLLPAMDGTISASANQRCVFAASDDINVLDFNPIRAKYLKAALHGRTKGKQKGMSHPSAITNESRLDDDYFKEPVTSRLPYIKHVFKNTGTSNLHDVTIDDERLIRLHYNIDGETPEVIEVLHIGHPASATALSTGD